MCSSDLPKTPKPHTLISFKFNNLSHGSNAKRLPNLRCFITGCLFITSAKNILTIPYETFSHDGTALISFNMGELSEKEHPFLTVFMNLMHPKYM